MPSVIWKYSQGVWGYQVDSTGWCVRRGRRCLAVSLSPGPRRCPACGSAEVSAYRERVREIRALPDGRCPVLLRVTVTKNYCRECGHAWRGRIPFASTPSSRITRQLERTVVELCREMPMKAVAEHFGIGQETVRDAVRRSLRRKYADVPLGGVRHIGIDEIYAFRHAKASGKYVTVVRDVATGAVLEVARGKGAAALGHFGRRIRRFSRRVMTVSMDMSNSYRDWAGRALPGATVVFDRFHVAMSMNERLDRVRRRVCRDMDAETRRAVKGCRHLLLRNGGSLGAADARRLAEARKASGPLSDAYMLKERLRSVYAEAPDAPAAEALLLRWAADADATGVRELAEMAGLIRGHLGGILAYWETGRITNASSEGFNQKIRWLIDMAYGFRDYEFFRLKVFDLPSTKIKKSL